MLPPGSALPAKSAESYGLKTALRQGIPADLAEEVTFMASRNTRVIKVIALLLALYVSQVNVVTAKTLPLAGKLTVFGNKPLLIDGNKVNSGNAIVSGSQLKSPKGVRATIELTSLGKVDLAPETDLTLTFSEGSVAVYLRAGRVVLTTTKGVAGLVKTCETRIVRTDPTQISSAVTVVAGCPGPGAMFIKGTAGVAGMVSAGAAGAVDKASAPPCNRATNPSPSSLSSQQSDRNCGQTN